MWRPYVKKFKEYQTASDFSDFLSKLSSLSKWRNIHRLRTEMTQLDWSVLPTLIYLLSATPI